MEENSAPFSSKQGLSSAPSVPPRQESLEFELTRQTDNPSRRVQMTGYVTLGHISLPQMWDFRKTNKQTLGTVVKST